MAQLPIHKLGLPWIITSSLVSILSGFQCITHHSTTVAAIFIFFTVITALLVWFFRDPPRQPDPAALAKLSSAKPIISPADGKVTDIIQNENTVTVGVFLSILDCHIQHSPISGRVTRIERKAGKCLPAFLASASKNNVSCDNEIFNAQDKLTISVKQITGIAARRIVSFVQEGQSLERGNKLGMILLGSRVELTMPKNRVTLFIKEGDRLYTGQTIIGSYV